MASGEGIIADTGDTVRKVELAQSETLRESGFLNLGDLLRQTQLCQALAHIEGMSSDTVHLFGNMDGPEIFTSPKDTLTNGCHLLRQNHFRKHSASLEGAFSNAFASTVFREGNFNDLRRRSRIVIRTKQIGGNLFDIGADRNPDTIAITTGIIENAVVKYNILHLDRVESNRLQTKTRFERILFNLHDGCRDFKMLQGSAITQRVFTNALASAVFLKDKPCDLG